MSQKNCESGRHPQVELVKTVSSDEGPQPSAKCGMELSGRDGSKEEGFKDELMHIFERERAELEMYFDTKMEEVLGGISSRQIDTEETTREKSPALETTLVAKMTKSLQDEKMRVRDRLHGYASPESGTTLRQLDAKFGEQNSEFKENLEVMKQDTAREKIQMEVELRGDESELENNFGFRLGDAESSLQMLKDEFKSNLAKRRAMLGKQSHGIVTVPGDKLEAEYQEIFRKDMSHEKKEVAREKFDAETKFKKEKRQLENFFLRLAEAEAKVQSLKIESQQRMGMERKRRRKIVEFEEKLRAEYQMMFSRQISREKEEARRDKIEMEERLRKENLRLEENFNLKMSDVEAALKRSRAELQQRERMEKEHRDTIVKLETKLQEERQIRLLVERELQMKKAEFSTEESLNRNENERLRNEIENLCREIERSNKEVNREIVERELHRDSERYPTEKTTIKSKKESFRKEVDSPQEIEEGNEELTRENAEREIQKEDLRKESSDTHENERHREEINVLHLESEGKNKEIEKLLAIKQENELKILSLARRLEKRASRNSKQANSLRRRKNDGQIESPELSNKTTSEEGVKISERNSWDLEGSLRSCEAGILRANREISEHDAVVSFVEERRKILVVVTFEKRIEQGILRLLRSLLPKETITPTIRVLMT